MLANTTQLSKLSLRDLLNVESPNASTGIINGTCSNIVNWDDCALSWIAPAYKNNLANFWTPFEISMSQDKKDWMESMTAEEQMTFMTISGLLASMDSIQADAVMKFSDFITDSHVNNVAIIIAQQEVVHNHSYSYMLSSLVDKEKQNEIFNLWKTNHLLKERNQFLFKPYQDFVEARTNNTGDHIELFLKALVHDIILEGLNFYTAFSFFYNLARNGKMPASSTMINYINRDEQLHVGFFVNVFKQVLMENPQYVTTELEEFIKSSFRTAAHLEIKWGEYVIGNKFDGLTMNDVSSYVKFMTNKRVSQLGISEKIFPEVDNNPLKWITVFEDPNEMKTDFFHLKSRSYQRVTDENDDL